MEHKEKIWEQFRHPKHKKFKKALGSALFVLVVFLALNSMWNVFAKWGWVSPPSENRTITVNATGETTVAPDTASFNVTVLSRANDPKTVQDENTEIANNVVGFLKDQGIDEEDIKTTSYNLFPRYNYIDGRQIPLGYELNQTVQVKVRDIEKAGGLLAGVVEAGANQVSAIRFFVDDPDGAKSLARKEAFTKARKKADELANAAGVSIGQVVSFSESSNDFGPRLMFASAEDAGIGGGGPSPGLEPGTQEVQVSVSVTYHIR